MVLFIQMATYDFVVRSGIDAHITIPFTPPGGTLTAKLYLSDREGVLGTEVPGAVVISGTNLNVTLTSAQIAANTFPKRYQITLSVNGAAETTLYYGRVNLGDSSPTPGGGGISTETDPISTAQLSTHKTSGDHDGRYTLSSHPSATDPHGDRAYTDSRVNSLAASGVSITRTGLVIVTGSTVQAALAQLDAAVADNQAIELGYVSNESGTVQVVNTTSDFVDGLSLTLAQNARPIYMTARVIVDVTGAPATSNSGVANLLIVDGAGNPLEQALFPVEGSSGTNGYLTCRVEARIAPNTAGQTYKVQINRTGSTSFAGNIMHGSVSPIFRSWFKAEKR